MDDCMCEDDSELKDEISDAQEKIKKALPNSNPWKKADKRLKQLNDICLLKSAIEALIGELGKPRNDSNVSNSK